jgi:hypothetical protein
VLSGQDYRISQRRCLMSISRGKPKELREEPAPLPLCPISGVKSAAILLAMIMTCAFFLNWQSTDCFLILHITLQPASLLDFKGFWRWYMTFRTIGFLDFVHRPVL